MPSIGGSGGGSPSGGGGIGGVDSGGPDDRGKWRGGGPRHFQYARIPIPPPPDSRKKKEEEEKKKKEEEKKNKAEAKRENRSLLRGYTAPNQGRRTLLPGDEQIA